ncbi:MAG TPA: tail fiber protein [Symbiobacteriaceae bacterium]|nr:tail fiber protein [Symbiobacteriaceae bacterium]
MDPFIGEIRIFAGNFAPYGWALCNGQLLPIQQNTALFALLGVTYGGDGKTNFALPNLQGRAPMHEGQGPGLTNRTLGESDGSQYVTLIQTEMPNHTHTAQCLSGTGTQSSTEAAVWGNIGRSGAPAYAVGPVDKQMNVQALQPAGSSMPHNNMQPYLGLTFIISLQGIFPQRP